MRGLIPFLIVLAMAAAAPLVEWSDASAATPTTPFPGWPAQYRQPGVRQLALSPEEQSFARSFPGKLAKFSDGQRHHIVRFIERPTRRLHPASDCYRASGFRVTPLARCPPGTSATGCFEAVRDDQHLIVHERIHDDEGNAWSDVSAWFWAAQRGRTRGPWWSTTIVMVAR